MEYRELLATLPVPDLSGRIEISWISSDDPCQEYGCSPLADLRRREFKDATSARRKSNVLTNRNMAWERGESRSASARIRRVSAIVGP